MIPLMSLMIGAYIVTRMLEIFGRDDPDESTATKIILKVCSIGTIFIAIYCVYSIFSAGADVANFNF
jgi:hypothetical protein